MVFERLRNIIAEQLGIEPSTITIDTVFGEDIDVDSLDLVEMMMAIEDEFGIDEIDEETAASIKTVGDIVKIIGEAE